MPCARSWTWQASGPFGPTPDVHTGRSSDDPRHLELFSRTDENRVRRRLERQHVARGTIRRGPIQMQPSALPDREAEDPPCRPSTVPVVASTIGPERSPSWRDRKPRVSPSAMKQMSCESGLAATARPRRAASARTSALVESPEREHRVARAAPRSARRARTTGPCRRRPSASDRPSARRAWWPVTTASKPRARARSSTAAELDLLVAAQARVRSATGRVLGDEVVDHVGPEPLGEVPDVERDVEDVGARRASWASSTDAAAARAVPQRRRCADSARWTPVTSWPASTARAAATAESTPPLIAASTLIRRSSGSWQDRRQTGSAGPLDDRPDRLDRPRSHRPRSRCGRARIATSRER